MTEQRTIDPKLCPSCGGVVNPVNPIEPLTSNQMSISEMELRTELGGISREELMKEVKYRQDAIERLSVRLNTTINAWKAHAPKDCKCMFCELLAVAGGADHE